MEQKTLLVLVVLALVGIAYYVRFKPHRSHGAATAETATAAPKGPKVATCGDNCVRTWTKCSANCSMDRPCSNRCDHAKESCQAACP